MRVLIVVATLFLIAGCSDSESTNVNNDLNKQDAETSRSSEENDLNNVDGPLNDELQYEHLVQYGGVLNARTSQFLYHLQQNNLERMQEFLHEELSLVEEEGDIILKSSDKEVPLSFSDESLEWWFIEGITFYDNGNQASVTVRPFSIDLAGEPVQESRVFFVNIVKGSDIFDWIINYIER
ncbi:hypothetical protein ACLIA0_15005 [Bacillaceae bacterium W0354]